MEQILYQHARQSPDKEAIVEGSSRLTYSELLKSASKLMRALSLHSVVKHDEPIGILLPAGLKQVVAQVAVHFANATCVPLDIAQPRKRIISMLHEIGVKKLLLDPDLSGDFPEFSCIPVGGLQTGNGDEDVQNNLNFANEKNADHKSRRSHILFTSGSTGGPKAVQIMEKGILHLASQSPVTPLLKDDRVAAFNSPGFDLSLFEIWVTLLSGATIVVIPKQVVLDSGAFSEFLVEHQVSVTIIPTALFNITVSVSPAAFHPLRHVLVAGEVASVQAMRSVLKTQPPQHLWNAYGPTEGTTMVTMFEVTLEETQRSQISIGFHVGETGIILIDENAQPIWESGISGEICIEGPGKSIGYLNKPDENAERFVELPRKDDDSRVQVYRTGDIGQWRKDLPGCLDFLGRQDTQVKHQSFRIELEEIERVLQTNEGVKYAVVVKLNQLKPAGSSVLVAHVIPCNGEKMSTEALLEFSRKNLPYYMVPNRIELVSNFPLTSNGKVDRRALSDRPDSTQSPTWSSSTRQSNSKPLANGANAETVIQIWKDLLGASNVDANDDFFVLGGTSLQSAALIALIQDRTGRLITMEELHRNSQLSSLLRFLERGETYQGMAADDTMTWKRGVDVVDDISLVPDWESENEGKVFLTGATGFVGVHLLHHLLRRPGVKQVLCLARRKGNESPAARLQQAMEKYDLYSPSLELAQKLHVLEGDMGERDLGLGQEKYDWLTNWVSVIFHVGAKVNFNEAYEEHYRDNVLGTRNVLELAALGRRKAFHYMSTIDAYGPTGYILGTRVMLEDAPILPQLQAMRFDLGYAQSQWTAESMVRRMRDRGLPVAIYRPGFVIGHSETGACNPDDFVTRLFVGCIQMGLFPRLPDMRLEYITVDYLIAATMHIASSNKNLGRSYHMVSPDQTKSWTTDETFKISKIATTPWKWLITTFGLIRW